MGTPSQWYEPQAQSSTDSSALSDFLARKKAQPEQPPDVNPMQVMQSGGANPYAQAQQTIANVPTPQPLTPANNQQTAAPTRGGMIKNVLRNFLYYGGQAAMHEAGLPTDVELAQVKSKIALENAQTQLTQAQAGTFTNTVQTPLGPMPAATWQKLGPAYLQSQGRVQGAQIGATAKSQASLNQLRGVLAKGGFDLQQDEDGSITGVKPLAELSAVQQAQVELQKAHADVLTNPNNPTYQQKEREIQARLAMARASLSLRQQGNARQNAQFQINNGVTPTGQPASIVGAGQMLDDQGSPIGKSFNSINGPTAANRTMGQMASTVLPHIEELKTEIKQNAADLGPFMGRMSDALMNGVGSTGDPVKDQRLGKLFGDLKLLTSAVARTHFGGKSGPQAVAYFHGLLNSAKSPEAIQGVLDSVRPYMVGYQGMGTTRTTANQGSNPRQPPISPITPSGTQGSTPASKYGGVMK